MSQKLTEQQLNQYDTNGFLLFESLFDSDEIDLLRRSAKEQIHLGKLYLFQNEDAKNQFLADPIPYTPVLNEVDVVRFFEERVIVPGKREWGVKDPNYQRMFFFADEAAMNHFIDQHLRYTDAAIEVMQTAVRDANPGS